MNEKFGAVQQKWLAGAAEMQAKWVEQQLKSIDDCTALMKRGVEYWSALSADARKLTTELLP